MAWLGDLQSLTGKLNAVVEEVLAVDGDIYEKHSDEEPNYLHHETNRSHSNGPLGGMFNPGGARLQSVDSDELIVARQQNNQLHNRVAELEDLLAQQHAKSLVNSVSEHNGLNGSGLKAAADSSDDESHRVNSKSKREAHLEQCVQNLEEELNDSIADGDAERRERERLQKLLSEEKARAKKALETVKTQEREFRDVITQTGQLVKEASRDAAKAKDELLNCNETCETLKIDDQKCGEGVSYQTKALQEEITLLTERLRLTEDDLNKKAEAIEANSSRTINNLQNRLEEAEKEFSAYKEEAQGSHRAQLAAKDDAYHTLKNELKNAIGEHERQLRDKATSSKEALLQKDLVLQTRQTELQRIQQETAGIQGQLDSSRAIIQGQQKEIEELESQISELETAQQTLQASLKREQAAKTQIEQHAAAQARQVSSNSASEKSEEVMLLRLAAENLKQQCQAKEAERLHGEKLVVHAKEELEQIKQKCHAYQEANNQLSIMVRDREEKIATLEKVQSHAQSVQLAVTNQGDEILVLKKERDDAIKASERRRAEAQNSSNHLKNLSTENDKIKAELDRLRKHTILKEDEHEEDMLIVKERENQALAELARVQTRLKKLQFSDVSEGQRAQVKADQASEQLRVMVKEKGQVEQKVAGLQAKNMEYERQLGALQGFLQNLQQEQQIQYDEQISRARRESERLRDELKLTMKERNELKKQIDSVHEGMQAANRLHRQLDEKDKKMTKLQQIIAEQHREYENLQVNQAKLMKQLADQRENLVELPLIKNLVVQYVQLASGRAEEKEPLLRTISHVLKLDAQELDRILNVAGCKNRGWMGWITRGPSPAPLVSIGASLSELPVRKVHTPKPGEDKIGAMFVQFLETESAVRSPVVLPANAMAAAYKSKRSTSQSSAMGITDMSIIMANQQKMQQEQAQKSTSSSSKLSMQLNSAHNSSTHKPIIPLPADSIRSDLAPSQTPIILQSSQGGIATVLPDVKQSPGGNALFPF